MGLPMGLPMLSLGQAARAAGLSKSSISRAISSGRLSATRNAERGGWDITEDELFKVFPVANGKPVATPVGNGKLRRSETPKKSQSETVSAVEIAVLRAKLEAKDELHQALQNQHQTLLAQMDDSKADRDAWRHQAENTARLLAARDAWSHQAEATQRLLAAPKRWWWQRVG